MEDIILVGGGGHCKSCIDVVEMEGKYTIKGIVDLKEKVGQSVMGYPIIGCDDDLPEIAKKYNNFLITLGQIKSAETRIKIFNFLKIHNVKLPVIISPKAYVSKHSTIKEGTVIMHGAVVNAETKISENCIINTGALIEHEVIVGANTHVSTRAILNGQVEAGEECFIGSNTVVGNNLKIANNTIIAAGSQVLKDIKISGTYIGNPLIKIK